MKPLFPFFTGSLALGILLAPLVATADSPREALSREAPNASAWALAPLEQALPPEIRRNLTYLREDLLDAGHSAPTAGEASYKAGSELCNLLIAAIDEHERAAVEAGLRAAQAEANTKVTSQALEARRNYKMSWPQYAREVDQRAELQRQQSNKSALARGVVRVDWSKRVKEIQKALDEAYMRYREALRKDPDYQPSAPQTAASGVLPTTATPASQPSPPQSAPAVNVVPIQQGKGHPFACTDYSAGKVFLVSAEGKIEWEYATKSCNDLWVLPNGNLLFNTGHGVQEVTREKKIVFDYQSKSEIYACQRLPDGNTFIGECSAGRLIELDPAGKIVKEIKLLPEGKDGGHLFMRNARRLENGNYLVTHYGEQVVREYDSAGQIVREIPATGGPHSAIRLRDGNTLIATGDRPGGHRVFEVDKDDKTVWEVKEEELPGLSLKFMAGLQRLPNGNTVMSNWLGHGQFGKSAHVIEVTKDKQVVWTFADHQTMKTISSIQLLDVPGDVTKGEIAH